MCRQNVVLLFSRGLVQTSPPRKSFECSTQRGPLYYFDKHVRPWLVFVVVSLVPIICVLTFSILIYSALYRYRLRWRKQQLLDRVNRECSAGIKERQGRGATPRPCLGQGSRAGTPQPQTPNPIPNGPNLNPDAGADKPHMNNQLQLPTTQLQLLPHQKDVETLSPRSSPHIVWAGANAHPNPNAHAVPGTSAQQQKGARAGGAGHLSHMERSEKRSAMLACTMGMAFFVFLFPNFVVNALELTLRDSIQIRGDYLDGARPSITYYYSTGFALRRDLISNRQPICALFTHGLKGEQARATKLNVSS